MRTIILLNTEKSSACTVFKLKINDTIRDLEIKTSKTTMGLYTNCSSGVIDGNFRSVVIFGDYSARVKHEAKRVTEKVLIAAHASFLAKHATRVIVEFCAFYDLQQVQQQMLDAQAA